MLLRYYSVAILWTSSLFLDAEVCLADQQSSSFEIKREESVLQENSTTILTEHGIEETFPIRTFETTHPQVESQEHSADLLIEARVIDSLMMESPVENTNEQNTQQNSNTNVIENPLLKEGPPSEAPKIELKEESSLQAPVPQEKTEKTFQEKLNEAVEEPGAVMFTPPENWVVADPKMLPPSVKVMVIGKGETGFPPSINLGMEPYKGTVRDYLKVVKAINESQNAEWKDLGQIRTQAGNASLSQVDMKTEWGDLRLMHVILKRGDTLYVLTSAALKDEYPKYFADFFTSMRSLRFNKDAMEMIKSPRKRSQLQKATKQLKEEWQSLYDQEQAKNQKQTSSTVRELVFNGEAFQKNHWEVFKAMLSKDFEDMGSSWQQQMIRKMQSDLLADESEQKK